MDPRRTTVPLLPGFAFKKKLSVFAGATLKGNPREARPITTKSAMHLILRSSHASGAHSFLGHARAIEALILRQAADFGVKVYDLANAGNHLHLIVKPLHRRAFRDFLRAITGLIARLVLGAERGRPRCGTKTAGGKGIANFWNSGRPFSRVVAWGRDFKSLKRYLLLNRLETSTTSARRGAIRRSELRSMLAEIESMRCAGVGFT